MFLRKISFFCGLVFLAVGCTQGAGESVSDQENAPNARQANPFSSSQSAQTSSTIFENTSFSSFVDVSQDREFIRFDFSFFPDGSGFDFDQKKVTIPCTFFTTVPEGVNAQVSAPLEVPCEPFTLLFDEEGEALTLDGIISRRTSAVEKFKIDFNLELNLDGFKDAIDGILLTSQRGKLEDFYQQIVSRHSQPNS